MAGFSVYFIRSLECDPGPAMVEAFEAMTEMMHGDGDCNWMDEDVCRQQFQTKCKQNVFIFEDFGTSAFRHLVNTGNRVYGPLCVLACLKNSEVLPRSTPVYCMALSGYTVSFTSIPKAAREKLQEKITWMSGVVSAEFHDQVTHLVAGEVGSKKYIVASKLKKQIMSPDWVKALWEASRTQLVNGNDPKYLKDYRCLLFQGFVVSASGLDSAERTRVKELIESEGGKYSGEMRIKECTHLIITRPKGQKYEFAKKWKIHIVQPQWIVDSIAQGYCLEESLYKVDEAETGADNPVRGYSNTSTPTSESTNGRRSILHDISAISMTTVNDTAMTTLNATLNNTTRRLSEMPIKRQTLSDADAWETIDISKYESANFLDGCKIFLSGFTGWQMDKLRKIINMGGASRFSAINESVSHVVVGQAVDEHLGQVARLATRPRTVTVNWLIDSMKENRCADENQYLPPDITLTDNQATPEKLPTQLKRKSGVISEQDQTFHSPAPQGVPAIDNNDMEDILSQYLPQKQDSVGSMGESTLMRAAEMAEFGGSSRNISRKSTEIAEGGEHPPRDETMVEANRQSAKHISEQDMETQDPNETTVAEELEETQIFKKKSFVIIGFNETQTTDLVNFIEELGGCIAASSSRAIPDFAVVPVMGFPVERTVGEIVTNAYLQMSAERGALQNVEDNEIYTPLNPIDESMQPLQDCVISISGYAGTERDALLHVAMVLGAHCQDYLVRKAHAKRNLKANTHLVVNTNAGSKYEAARKWQIPVVSKRWLISCAKQSRRLPEVHYDIDKEVADSHNDDHVTDNQPADNLSGHQMPPPVGTPGQTRRSTARSASTLGDNSPLRRNARDEVDVGLLKEHHGEDTGGGNVTSAASVADSAMETEDTVHEEIESEPAGKTNQTEIESGRKESSLEARGVPPTMANDRVKRLIEENRRSLPRSQKSPCAKPADDGWETPSKFGVGAVFKPQFDFEEAYECYENMETPGRTPVRLRETHKRKSSLPLDEFFSVQLQRAIQLTDKPVDKPRVPASPALPRPPGPGPLQQGTPRPLEGVVIAVAKKLIAKQSEYNNIAGSLGADYRWSFDSTCTHYLFQGRQNDVNKEFRTARQEKKLIVSPHWLLQCQEENRRVDESLFPHTYNPNMSLTIETSDTPVRPKRSTRTRQSSRSVKLEAENVPPPSPKPGISNQLATSDSDTTSTRRSSRLTRSRDKIDTDEDESRASVGGAKPVTDKVKASKGEGRGVMDRTQSDDEISRLCGDIEIQENKSKNEAYVNDLKNLMASTSMKTYGKRRKSRGTNSSLDTSGLTEDSASTSAARLSRPSSRAGSRDDDDVIPRKKSRGGAHTVMPQTQSVEPSQFEVAWDDPNARAQMEMIASDLAKNSESFSPKPEDLEENQPADSVDVLEMEVQTLTRQKSEDCRDSGPIPTPEPPTFAMLMPKSAANLPVPQPVRPIEEENTAPKKVDPPSPPKFILSGIARQERDDYGALVERLGGELIDSQTFTSRATHLVVESPARNEKFLGSIASGMWILHKSYFEACRNANKFQEERVYEWGSDETVTTLSNPVHVKWAKAARRWREKVTHSKQGAFAGWKVLLLSKKIDSFVRLLEAGGATVLSSRPPYSSKHLNSCTHAFFDSKLVEHEITEEELVTLVNSGAKCLKPEFLSEYLMEEKPAVQNYAIPQISQLPKSDKRKADTIDDLPSTPRSKKQRL